MLTPPNSPPPTQLPPLRARSEEIKASAPQPIAPAPLASAPPVAAPEPTPQSPGQHQLPIASQPQHVPAPTGPRAKIGFFNGKQVAQSLQVENDRLNALIAQHGLLSVAELDATIRGYQAQAIQVQQDIAAQAAQAQQAQRAQADAAHAELLNVRRDIDAARAHLLSEQATLEAERRRVLDVRATIDIQDLGLYDYEHPAEISATLGTSLESLRQQIKDAVRNKQAVTTTSGFTFNNSEAKGRKFVSDMSNILLRAYNAEAENCIKAVRAGNLHTAQARLSKVRDQIARQGTMISLQITEYYHHLRLQEMELASRHLQALQREKELERERREELREQRKAELELRKEQERLANERKHYLNALAVLQANGDVEGLERMQARIADVDRAIADVDYRTANIRAGYVYVISNLGAFGGNMVKIGMTRRLEPMDRVNELGDASVPFKFDVHALFFAADAVGVESTLHKHFAEHRVNKVNLRREFFNVTPQAVLDALRSHSVEVLEFRSEAEAPEYRMSGAVLA
ncbi:DUF4041 domain-containing protein [Plantibacter sp. YIM 135249]|uniref:DUF4041 domain-containing protein n=1 Tax=Plantibacter sp. YIM 135249 TaxID=3423918 RepID=UPI003D357F7D